MVQTASYSTVNNEMDGANEANDEKNTYDGREPPCSITWKSTLERGNDTLGGKIILDGTVLQNI